MLWCRPENSQSQLAVRILQIPCRTADAADNDSHVDDSGVVFITQQRSTAERGGCFRRCLFVCLFVCTITAERLNVG